MGERRVERGDERRRAERVSVRGGIVLHADDGPLHGTLENLSEGGALVGVGGEPRDRAEIVELELQLPGAYRTIAARTVRSERRYRSWRHAIAFERVDPTMREAIAAAIEAARFAARRRPVLVIDDHAARRSSLIDRLARSGLTPLAPRTPLDAFDLLTRAQLHVSVCLLAPGFGISAGDLASALAESFPWLTTQDISDDLDATVSRALAAASAPDARPAAAIG